MRVKAMPPGNPCRTISSASIQFDPFRTFRHADITPLFLRLPVGFVDTHGIFTEEAAHLLF